MVVSNWPRRACHREAPRGAGDRGKGELLARLADQDQRLPSSVSPTSVRSCFIGSPLFHVPGRGAEPTSSHARGRARRPGRRPVCAATMDRASYPDPVLVVLDLVGIFVFAITGPWSRPQGARRLRGAGAGRRDGPRRRLMRDLLIGTYPRPRWRTGATSSCRSSRARHVLLPPRPGSGRAGDQRPGRRRAGLFASPARSRRSTTGSGRCRLRCWGWSPASAAGSPRRAGRPGAAGVPRRALRDPGAGRRAGAVLGYGPGCDHGLAVPAACRSASAGGCWRCGAAGTCPGRRGRPDLSLTRTGCPARP